MIRVLFYILRLIMKIKKLLMAMSLTLSSTFTFATQPTDASVEQLFKTMNIESVLQQTLKQIRPQLDQQAYITVQNIVKHEQLTPQEQIVANELADQMYQQSLKMVAWENVKPIYQKIYKDVYTAEEVKAQIDFYSSPAGQSILKKSPLVAQESMKMIHSKLGQTLKTTEQDLKQINQKLEALKKAANQK